MIRCVYNYYLDPVPARNAELQLCMKKLGENSLIQEFHIIHSGNDSFVPHRSLFSGKTLFEYLCEDRPTFRKLFELANKVVKPEDITIFINSDCYISDEGIKLIIDNLADGMVYCLSRWDLTPSGNLVAYHLPYSQDAWIFKGQIKLPKVCNFLIGAPGCDNRLASELYNIGYTLKNPAEDVILVHVHNSNIRRRLGLVGCPYRDIEITGV